jgi:hypothetical protein
MHSPTHGVWRLEQRGRMRTLLAALLLTTLSPVAGACDCFPPELQAKAAQDALQSARLAVYGRVIEVAASGTAKVVVLESFKGPARGSTIETAADSGRCEASAFSLGEEALVLSFREAVTACDKYPPEHFLLDAFRANAAK